MPFRSSILLNIPFFILYKFNEGNPICLLVMYTKFGQRNCTTCPTNDRYI